MSTISPDVLPFNHFTDYCDFEMAIAQLHTSPKIDNDRWKSLLLNPLLIEHHPSFSHLIELSNDSETIIPTVIHHDYLLHD